ncbi:MAG: hypothetical protein R3F62_22670 [Planctomycetota bacterium]
MTDSDRRPPTRGSRRDERPPVDTTRLGTGCLWAAPLSLILWALILWGALAIYRGFQPP